MVYVERPQAAAAFLGLLDDAARLVGERWFLVPYAARDEDESAAAYRERVYCYELYHQLRALSDGPRGTEAGAPAYVLSGEIAKAGLNAVIEDGKHQPDLVWHVPGSSSFNAVVVEVKRSKGLDDEGLRKDLNTLKAFLHEPERGYERGVLLVFGPMDPNTFRDRVLRLAESVDFSDEVREKVHLVWHMAAEEGITKLGTLSVG